MWSSNRKKSTSRYGNKTVIRKILLVLPDLGGSYVVGRHVEAALNRLGLNVFAFDGRLYWRYLNRALTGLEDPRERKETAISLFGTALLEKTVEFEPDLILVFSLAPLWARTLMMIGKLGIQRAYWLVEDFRLCREWEQVGAYYDHVFVIQKAATKALKETGIEHVHHLPNAANHIAYRPLTLSEEQQQRYGAMLSFVGFPTANRVAVLEKLADLDLAVWGGGWDRVQMAKGLKRRLRDAGRWVEESEANIIANAGKITLNIHSHDPRAPESRDFLNPRTFSVCAAGMFQLVDEREELADYLVPGEEIVVYHSVEELRSLITYYLGHWQEAQAIAARGRKRVLREHTYEARMRRMLTALGSPESATPEAIPENEVRFRRYLARIRETVSRGDRLNRRDRIVLLTEAIRTSSSWAEIGYGRPRPDGQERPEPSI